MKCQKCGDKAWQSKIREFLPPFTFILFAPINRSNGSDFAPKNIRRATGRRRRAADAFTLSRPGIACHGSWVEDFEPAGLINENVSIRILGHIHPRDQVLQIKNLKKAAHRRAQVELLD